MYLFKNEEVYNLKKISAEKDGQYVVYKGAYVETGDSEITRKFNAYDVTTTGYGNSGSYEFLKSPYKKVSEEKRNEAAKMLFDIALGNLKYVGEISEAMNLINEIDNASGYHSDMLNIAKLDQATVTDEYISSVNGNVYLRKGKNTDKIIEYMGNVGYPLGSNPVENNIAIYRYGDSIKYNDIVNIRMDIFDKLNIERKK